MATALEHEELLSNGHYFNIKIVHESGCAFFYFPATIHCHASLASALLSPTLAS